MKTDDYQKAKTIHEDAAKLTQHINVLRRILETKIKRISIQSDDARPGDCYELETYNDSNRTIKNQPESVQTLLETFPAILLAAYEKELRKLEKQFDNI